MPADPRMLEMLSYYREAERSAHVAALARAPSPDVLAAGPE